MNYQKITKMQKEYNVFGMQAMINSGRHASNLLDIGVCMLPKKHMRDYYGSSVPSRDDLKPGTKGTYLNSKNFWSDWERVDEFFNQEQ